MSSLFIAVVDLLSHVQLFATLDCSPPGSSVHRIFWTRILEWVAISSIWDLPDPGVKLESPALAGGLFTPEAPGKLVLSLILAPSTCMGQK